MYRTNGSSPPSAGLAEAQIGGVEEGSKGIVFSRISFPACSSRGTWALSVGSSGLVTLGVFVGSVLNHSLLEDVCAFKIHSEVCCSLSARRVQKRLLWVLVSVSPAGSFTAPQVSQRSSCCRFTLLMPLAGFYRRTSFPLPQLLNFQTGSSQCA